MKAKLLLTLGLLLVAGTAIGYTFTDVYTANEWWGFNNIIRSRTWVGPDGRMGIQSQMANMSTALDLWPTANPVPPITDSFAEITIHRTPWEQTDTMERLNISSMVQADGGAYRIGVERGGVGNFYPIIFCFENVTPGVAVCPLKVQLDGVYVVNSDGSYTKLGS